MEVDCARVCARVIRAHTRVCGTPRTAPHYLKAGINEKEAL
jgi:hypothetical protein